VEILSAKRPPRKTDQAAPAGDVTGRWDVQLAFAAGTSTHTLHVRQQGSQIAGTHQGDFVSRECFGSIAGADVSISSNVGEEHGAALSYKFTGKLDGDTMLGDLDMGEYLKAKWTAKRHVFGRGGAA
jgi:hypothetical protein